MPTAPPRRCTRCHQLHTGRGPRCPVCQREQDARRPSAARRGLGHDHRKVAAQVLADAVVCAVCGKPGTKYDPLTGGHIIDRQAGGTNDPGNYQPEHLSCNSGKKAAGSRIVLVAGPPCAGKTTYVEQHAAEGDLVLDLDQIARDLGSTRYWHHDDATRRRAERVMRRQILRLAATRRGRAWVIRCVPDGRARAGLARMVRADEVVVLLPPGPTLVKRARERPDPVGTVRAINAWLGRYTEAPVDTVIKVWRRSGTPAQT